MAAYLKGAIAPVASVCASVWDSVERLDAALQAALAHLKGAKLVYAVNCDGVQFSSNVSAQGIDPTFRGQMLAVRPYLKSVTLDADFVLSPVYVDNNDHEPCLTALRKVYASDGTLLGCLAIDYDVNDLPGEGGNFQAGVHWRQIKGDPAIRQNLFQQERVSSAMDEHIEAVNDLVSDLFEHRGVFHVKLHYSSCRATLWLYRDPHRYRLHVLDEIIDPSICLAYPKASYPPDALIPADQVPVVFGRFRQLRDADSTIYLRSASLNIVNGMVGLTFSCDGSHYMSVNEFLSKDDSFWFGVS